MALTSPITAEDAASGFTCGERALDAFFARHALDDHDQGIGTTCVLRESGESEPVVVGSHTRSIASVPAKPLRKSLGRSIPRYDMPVALLGRLAAYEAARRRGLGQRPLGGALRRVATAEQHAGRVGVVVDAKHEAAERFYSRGGFVLIEETSRLPRRFLPRSTTQAGLAREARDRFRPPAAVSGSDEWPWTGRKARMRAVAGRSRRRTARPGRGSYRRRPVAAGGGLRA